MSKAYITQKEAHDNYISNKRISSDAVRQIIQVLALTNDLL